MRWEPTPYFRDKLDECIEETWNKKGKCFTCLS